MANRVFLNFVYVFFNFIFIILMAIHSIYVLNGWKYNIIISLFCSFLVAATRKFSTELPKKVDGVIIYPSVSPSGCHSKYPFSVSIIYF